MANLEVNDEWRNKKQSTDHAKPDPTIDEVRVCAKQDPGNKRDELCSTSRIDDIGDSQRTGDDTDEEIGHDELREDA